MKRILVFTSLYPSRRFPAKAVFSYQRYQALASYFDLRLVAPVPWWTRLRWPEELVATPRERSGAIDVSFPTYWSLPRLTAVHGIAMYRSLVGHLETVRRDFPFDLILAAWATPDGVAAARLAEHFDCPLITSVLGSDINECTRYPILRWQIRAALDRAQRVVAVSQALGDAVVRLGVRRDRVLVQHNGVDGGRFVVRDRDEVRAALGLPSDRLLVGYVGNLVREKGVDVLIEAMGLLSGRSDRPIDAVLVGSGNQEAPLRQRAQALGIEQRVRFVGRQLHAAIPSWMSAFDVFCLPSRREGCPNVVLEALASGRPVVASRVGGVPELLGPHTGIMVPADQPAALSDALVQALDANWQTNVLRHAVPALSWDAWAQTYRRAIDTVVDGWPRSR